jgi:hypothetical protein
MPVTAPAAPTSIPAQRGSDPMAVPVSPRPRLFARRGVQILLVGLLSLGVGIMIGATTMRSAAKPRAIQQPPAPAQIAAPTAANVHAAASAHQSLPQPSKQVHSKAAAPTQPNDKGWVVQSLAIKRDFVGEFTGTARITNTNTTSKSASFTFTLFRHGGQVAELQGVIDDVAAGKTVTVDLVTQDPFSAGAFTYDFQADFSF